VRPTTIRCAREGQVAGALDKASGDWLAASRPGLWIKCSAVGYVVLGLTYALGAPLLGIGLYLVIRGSFPGWWREWMQWPVVRVTPGVARLQGVTAIGLGASLVGLGLSTIVSEFVGGMLVLIAMVAYVVGVVVFVYSTWLSRRGTASS
jgi:hypothetical protein